MNSWDSVVATYLTWSPLLCKIRWVKIPSAILHSQEVWPCGGTLRSFINPLGFLYGVSLIFSLSLEILSTAAQSVEKVKFPLGPSICYSICFIFLWGKKALIYNLHWEHTAVLYRKPGGRHLFNASSPGRYFSHISFWSCEQISKNFPLFSIRVMNQLRWKNR